MDCLEVKAKLGDRPSSWDPNGDGLLCPSEIDESIMREKDKPFGNIDFSAYWALKDALTKNMEAGRTFLRTLSPQSRTKQCHA